MKLLGKRALVTGSARGIGRGCALELARAGADVVINDRDRTPGSRGGRRRDPGAGAGGGAGRGGRLRARLRASRSSAAALDAFGRLDILVSNPAFSRRDDFLELSHRDVPASAPGDAGRRVSP